MHGIEVTGELKQRIGKPKKPRKVQQQPAETVEPERPSTAADDTSPPLPISKRKEAAQRSAASGVPEEEAGSRGRPLEHVERSTHGAGRGPRRPPVISIIPWIFACTGGQFPKFSGQFSGQFRNDQTFFFTKRD